MNREEATDHAREFRVYHQQLEQAARELRRTWSDRPCGDRIDARFNGFDAGVRLTALEHATTALWSYICTFEAQHAIYWDEECGK